MPMHEPAGAGKNAKTRRLLARGSQVGVELYRIHGPCKWWRGGHKGLCPPPLSYHHRKQNACIEILTLKFSFSAIFKMQQPTLSTTTPPTLYIHQLNVPLLKILSILLDVTLHYMGF